MPSAIQIPLRLALQRAPLLGPVAFRQLRETCGAPETWHRLPEQRLRSVLSQHQWSVLASLLASEPERYPGVQQDLEWLAGSQHQIVCVDQAEYPLLLRQIHDAPSLLFVRGQAEALRLPQLAVVGSRHPTKAGLKDCFEFSSHLARQGFAITSGLALGIDGAAHSAALEAGGITLAVLAHGMQQVYPGRHRALAERIASQGALISEFPLGVEPAPEYFPRRNRIISGLSLGVLVVEAAMQSGSLITAMEAMDQGREVFAIPGSIHNPLARGCHRLIRQGAKLVETGQDIVEDLGPLLSMVLPGLTALATRANAVVQPEKAHPSEKTTQLGRSTPSETSEPVLTPPPTEQRVLQLLAQEPCSVNALVEQSGLSTAEINAALMMLELEGQVVQMQGTFQPA